jgi:hypothetical protein
MLQDSVGLVVWMHVAYVVACAILGWTYYHSGLKWYIVVTWAAIVTFLCHLWGTAWWQVTTQELVQMFLLRFVTLSVLGVLCTQAGDFVKRFSRFLASRH